MIQKLIIDSKKVSFRKKISNFLTRFILYVYWENLLDIIVLPTFSVALNLSPNLGVGKYTQKPQNTQKFWGLKSVTQKI